jgi:hypothetical protein
VNTPKASSKRASSIFSGFRSPSLEPTESGGLGQDRSSSRGDSSAKGQDKPQSSLSFFSRLNIFSKKSNEEDKGDLKRAAILTEIESPGAYCTWHVMIKWTNRGVRDEARDDKVVPIEESVMRHVGVDGCGRHWLTLTPAPLANFLCSWIKNTAGFAISSLRALISFRISSCQILGIPNYSTLIS